MILLLKCFRWIRGYASFELVSDCPEKFINFSVKNKTNIWDLRKYGCVLTGKVLAQDYKNLHKYAKKTCSKIKLKSKFGFPFFKNKYRKRIGVLMGAIVFLCILYVLSLYVWSVNISGNENLKSDEILRVINSLGIKPGVLKKRIDVPIAEQEAMMKLSDVSWMSINISGSCVNVVIKEKVKKPDIAKEGEPCNIIAKCDGQIERLETFKGTPCVNAGEVVVKGQLLISGVVENLDLKNSFLEANGKVFANTKRKIIKKVKINQVRAKDTGKIINRCRVKILNLEIPFGFWKKINENYRSEITEKNVGFLGMEFPIKICKERWCEQQCEELAISKEEGDIQLEKDIAKYEEDNFQEANIIEKIVNKREENGEFIAEIEYNCIENIGVKEKINISP